MANFVFLGPPGSGKGTMSGALCRHRGMHHISTGNLLRAEIRDGSSLGDQVKAFVRDGRLVPDDLIVAVVQRFLKRHPTQPEGFILDGFPRTLIQAGLFDRILDEHQLTLNAAILLAVGDAAVIARLTERRVCRQCSAPYNVATSPPRRQGSCDNCGGELFHRIDDREETVRERLRIYHLQTEPLISLYEERGQLVEIDATGSPQTVLARFVAKLGELDV